MGIQIKGINQEIQLQLDKNKIFYTLYSDKIIECKYSHSIRSHIIGNNVLHIFMLSSGKDIWIHSTALTDDELVANLSDSYEKLSMMFKLRK